MYRKTGANKSGVLRSGSGGERLKPLYTCMPIKIESNVRQWRIRNGRQGRGGGRTMVRSTGRARVTTRRQKNHHHLFLSRESSYISIV